MGWRRVGRRRGRNLVRMFLLRLDENDMGWDQGTLFTWRRQGLVLWRSWGRKGGQEWFCEDQNERVSQKEECCQLELSCPVTGWLKNIVEISWCGRYWCLRENTSGGMKGVEFIWGGLRGQWKGKRKEEERQTVSDYYFSLLWLWKWRGRIIAGRYWWVKNYSFQMRRGFHIYKC